MAEILEQVEGDKTFLGNVEILGELKNAGIETITTQLERTRVEAHSARADLDSFLEEIVADGIADVSDKKILRQKWAEIETEYPIVRQRALDTGLSSQSQEITYYEAAYQALNNLLNGAGGILVDMTAATPIDRTEVELRFRNYYTARENLSSGTVSTIVASTSRVFFEQPVGPYRAGDLWISNGIMYQAATNRDAGEFIPGDWVWCIRANMTAVVESTNGDKFRPGQSATTTLIGRAFRNGVEVTNDLPDSAFKWTRKSFFPTSEDAVWNANHQTGYRTVEVTTDSIYARATYTLEISE
jgi:hypothetical protein